MPTVNQHYSRPDHWSLLAAKMGFPSRAMFKLKQIDDKFFQSTLFKPGYRVLDLGTSPGSWGKYSAERVAGGGGFTMGFDLNLLSIHQAQQRFEMPENFHYRVQNIFHLNTGQNQLKTKFHVCLSDLAPSTTGVAELDSRNSMKLAWRATELARDLLLPWAMEEKKLIDINEPPMDPSKRYNFTTPSPQSVFKSPIGPSIFIAKIFDGPSTELFLSELKPIFESIKIYKPPASRKESKETFIICQRVKNHYIKTIDGKPMNSIGKSKKNHKEIEKEIPNEIK